MDQQTVDLLIKLAEKFGLPLVVAGILIYFIFYKLFPDFLQRDKEKDEARSRERKEERDAFFLELGRLTSTANQATNKFEAGLEVHKEALSILKEQNKDVLKQVQLSHKDLVESLKLELIEISKKIDSILKELSTSK